MTRTAREESRRHDIAAPGELDLQAPAHPFFTNSSATELMQ